MTTSNRKFAALTQPGAQPGSSGAVMDEQTAQLARQWQDRFLQSVNLEEFIRLAPSQRRVRIEETLRDLMQASGEMPPYGQYNQVLAYILNEALGFGPLANLVNDPSVSEIMVNGPERVYIERDGKIQPEPRVRFQDEEHLRNLIDRIVARVGRRIDEASPMVDARLQDGSRVNVIIPPLSLDGPAITIRKFGRRPLSLDSLTRLDTLTPAMAQFLAACVQARLSILVSGGTGAGKTTLLNALAGFIGSTERVVTIEDSAELKFHDQHPHVVRAETRPANMQGKGAITIRDLVRNALRMRPDRIIVGEVRGAEALDMLQAMNTGHEGSMTTVHANSPEDALRRLETMVMWAEGAGALPLTAIREQIVSAIDIVVQIVRYPNGRKVAAISEVQELRHGDIVLRDLFRFDVFATDPATGDVRGQFDATGVVPARLSAIQTKGIQGLDAAFFQSTHFETSLRRLLEDPAVTEIMINGLEDTRVERQRQGISSEAPLFASEAELLGAINNIIAPLGKRLNARSPMVDARLAYGGSVIRVNVVVKPIALNGPILTIRRFPKEPLRTEDLLAAGTFSPEMLAFLRQCVQARFNILISGGTGSGKTTLLNVLSSMIVDIDMVLSDRFHDERIITIEDVAELQLQHDHWVRLEARQADEFDEGKVTIRDLVINTLRMRPDRIIVGEVRGAEALDMLQAMNTGHEGSMTTIHANSPADAFSRLETMVAWAGTALPAANVQAQIAGALDVIVQVNRLPNGKRRIREVAEVSKAQGVGLRVHPLFEYESAPGPDGELIEGWRASPPSTDFLERLQARQ